jgi:hypothetical protein
MYKFSEKSEQKLQTCHADLQAVLRAAIQLTNFTILDGARDEVAQNAAFAAGKSKLKYPHSKHNHVPSLAVDIAPFPVDWKNRERFAFLAGVIWQRQMRAISSCVGAAIGTKMVKLATINLMIYHILSCFKLCCKK